MEAGPKAACGASEGAPWSLTPAVAPPTSLVKVLPGVSWELRENIEESRSVLSSPTGGRVSGLWCSDVTMERVTMAPRFSS